MFAVRRQQKYLYRAVIASSNMYFEIIKFKVVFVYFLRYKMYYFNYNQRNENFTISQAGQSQKYNYDVDKNGQLKKRITILTKIITAAISSVKVTTEMEDIQIVCSNCFSCSEVFYEVLYKVIILSPLKFYIKKHPVDAQYSFI